MAKPVVAIVGRANVGKSTLFNKLIKKRIAITQDDPGVTRDRLYMEAEWQNKYFTVVDTGGLEPKSDEIITKNIKKQTELAIETADVILFMVDGKQGITPIDMEVADMLRRTKKSVILVVNKIDHIKQQDNVYDFYNLGFYEIFPISASNSMGLGDLLEAVVSKFDDNSNTESDDDITKVCLIGKPNVGKSSLINNLLNEERMIVTDIAGTTRDAIDSKINYKRNEYIFIDTAGLRKRKKIDTEVERYSVVRTLSAIDRSDICVLMIDATEGVSEQDTKILGYAHDQGKAMIILVNKWDLVEKQTNTMNDFKKDIRTKLGFVMYVPIVFISVKENKRIDTLFTEIEKVDNNYSMRISTGVLNDVISKAVLLNPPPSDKGVRLKIFYITQIEARPPKFLVFINRNDLMHFSYQRYIENQLRENFSFEGVPLQFEFKTRGK